MHCNEVGTLVIHTFENVNLTLKQASVSRHANSDKEKLKTPAGQFAPFSHMAGQVLWRVMLSLQLCTRIYQVRHAPAALWHMCDVEAVEMFNLISGTYDDGGASLLTLQHACYIVCWIAF